MRGLTRQQALLWNVPLTIATVAAVIAALILTFAPPSTQAARAKPCQPWPSCRTPVPVPSATPTTVPTPAPTPAATPPGVLWSHDFRTQGLGPFAYDPQWGEQGLVYTSCRNGNGGSHHNAAQSARMTALTSAGLVLTAKRTSGNEYESAILSTFAAGRLFGDGIIEARIRYDKGTGLWPAFWLLIPGSGPRDELDILEAYPNPTKWPFPNRHEANTHLVRNGTDTRGNFVHDAGFDLTTGFHVFGMERRGGTLRFFLDGVQWGSTSSNVPTGAMAILLDYKVGGFHGCADSTTPDIATMTIEWVRIRP